MMAACVAAGSVQAQSNPPTTVYYPPITVYVQPQALTELTYEFITGYSGLDCIFLSSGTWTLTTAPVSGIVSTQIVNEPFTCVQDEYVTYYVFPANVLYYTWTSTSPTAKTDYVAATWTAPNDIGGVAWSFNIYLCTAPIISSVAPDGWWAGAQQDITINGSCFSTSSDAGGASKVTVSDGAGAVTLSNVNVVSSTQITATVNVTKKAPAETVTLTVTNTSSNGASQSTTASPAPVVLPVPVIKWSGKTISGDKAKNQSVIVGQPVELTTTPASLPGGFTVSGSNWTIPGTNVQQFSHPNSGIVLTPTQTNQPNTTYYWLYPQDAMNVAYTYCATDPNGNQICESPEAKAVFKASSPGSLALATEDSHLALVQELHTCNPSGKLPFLEYGDLSGQAPGCGNDEGPAGIHLTASGASSGSYVFAQVVDADVSEYTHATGPSPTSCGAHAGLDRSFPYEAVEKQNPQTAYDGPQMPLPTNALTGTRNIPCIHVLALAA